MHNASSASLPTTTKGQITHRSKSLRTSRISKTWSRKRNRHFYPFIRFARKVAAIAMELHSREYVLATAITPTESLSTQEAKDLARYEKVIEQNLKAVFELGSAALAIRDNRLYKSHGTWEEYCRKRWNWNRDYANKIIRAAETVRELDTIVSKHTPLPQIESQVRELTKLESPEEKAEAWELAVEMAGGSQPTAAVVREAVVEIQEAKAEPEQAAPQNDVLPEDDTDPNGVVIPEHCKAILDTGNHFASVKSAFNELVRKIKTVSELPCGILINTSIIQAQLRASKKLFMSAEPYCICHACNGEENSSCDVCRQSGVITRELNQADDQQGDSNE